MKDPSQDTRPMGQQWSPFP